MYPEDVYRKLRSFSEATLPAVRELLPTMAPVVTWSGWSGDERTTICALLAATARSSESALLLLAFAQLWDAEILVRSIVEGSLKFALLLQDQANFPERFREYRHDLFRIALLKDHAKAEDLLSAVPDPDDRSWLPVRKRLLSEDEREAISLEFSRERRRELDRKWGFTGIIQAFGRSQDPLLSGFIGMADGYAMASHILHADHIGTSVPIEIDLRSPERRDALLVAHGVRLASDVMACLQLRLAVGFRFVGEDLEPVRRAVARMEAVRKSFGDAHAAWMAVEYPME